MYYIGICYYIFQNYHASNPEFTPMQIASNFTFTHGFFPDSINSTVPGGWSIGVEMMFYAILPFLFLKIKNLNQAFLFFIGSLMLMTILKFLFLEYSLIKNEILLQEFLFMYFPSQLPVFVLGMILYFILIEKENWKQIPIISFLILLSLALTDIFIQKQVFFPNHILFGIGFFILAYFSSEIKSKWWNNPILHHIGKISFSMYLVHFAVLYWMYQFDFTDFVENGILNYYIRYSIVIVSTVLISSLTYQCIEHVFQKIGRKFIAK
jgi:peptidoglycan/LPS O-acetylase OafA/YrhL